jgi:hypothetical protein
VCRSSRCRSRCRSQQEGRSLCRRSSGVGVLLLVAVAGERGAGPRKYVGRVGTGLGSWVGAGSVGASVEVGAGVGVGGVQDQEKEEVQVMHRSRWYSS